MSWLQCILLYVKLTWESEIETGQLSLSEFIDLHPVSLLIHSLMKSVGGCGGGSVFNMFDCDTGDKDPTLNVCSFKQRCQSFSDLKSGLIENSGTAAKWTL